MDNHSINGISLNPQEGSSTRNSSTIQSCFLQLLHQHRTTKEHILVTRRYRAGNTRIASSDLKGKWTMAKRTQQDYLQEPPQKLLYFNQARVKALLSAQYKAAIDALATGRWQLKEATGCDTHTSIIYMTPKAIHDSPVKWTNATRN